MSAGPSPFRAPVNRAACHYIPRGRTSLEGRSMRKLVIAGTILAAGTLTACSGSGDTPAPAGRTTTATPLAPDSAVGAKKIALGTILVDGSGRTLYLFEKDKGGMS